MKPGTNCFSDHGVESGDSTVEVVVSEQVRRDDSEMLG
jgi:hypothetical protein